MSETQERVACAANRHKETGLIVCGARHYDSVMRAVMKALNLDPQNQYWDQGFINFKGEFLQRNEALLIAQDACQIVRRCGGDNHSLFSENLG